MSDSDNEMINRLADARIVYEQSHGLTMQELADATGIDRRILAAQSRADGWRKQVKTGVTEEAENALARFSEWKETLHKAMQQSKSDSNIEIASPRPEDPIAVLLEKHKQEWMAARVLAHEAIKIRNTNPIDSFNRAKLAKILAEQIEIVQKGERRSWGIDDKDAPAGSVVVIERA